MSRPKVVITNRVFPETLEMLSSRFEIVSNQTTQSMTAEDLRRAAQDAWGILAFMPDRIDDALLSQCSKLQIVACALKGYDNFDVEACAKRGIWVTIVPDLLTEPTAELAIGLAIGLCRQIPAADRYVRSRDFPGWRPVFYGRSIDQSIVSIVGCGRVGHAIARKLSGFSCEIRMTDSDSEALAAPNAQLMPIDDATSQADIIFLAVPLLESTQHMVNAAWIKKLKRGALLINPARGSVVNEVAVADALESGQLGGYAADVFEFEDWARADRPAGIEARLLAAAEHTLLTPHIGSAVERVRREIEIDAARNMIECFEGVAPHGAVFRLS